MGDHGNSTKLRRVSINLGDTEGRIEEILPIKTESVKIRISSWSEDRSSARPLDISEKELVDLLQKAIHTGILSPDFLDNLRSEFEI